MKKYLLTASVFLFQFIQAYSETVKVSTIPELQTEAQKKLDTVVAEKNKGEARFGN